MKYCCICKNTKLLTKFHKSKRSSDGLKAQCKDCRNLYSRNFTKENPHLIKQRELKIDFNITLNQYNQMLKDQNECCALCNRHQSNFKRSLAVDHCHKTGRIRGLLCIACNTALGRFKDDIDLVNRIIKYLA